MIIFFFLTGLAWKWERKIENVQEVLGFLDPFCGSKTYDYFQSKSWSVFILFGYWDALAVCFLAHAS